MDGEALQPFLKTHAPPQMNISIDAQYSLVPANPGSSRKNSCG